MATWRLRASVGVLTLTTAGFGLLQSWAILTLIGPGTDSDLYFASATVPQLVLALSTTALVNVLVPLLANRDGQALAAAAWSTALVVAAVFAAAASLLAATAPYWILAVNPGFDGDAADRLVSLVRIQLLGTACMGPVAVASALCQVRDRFVWVESVNVITGALALGLLALTLTRYGVVAAASILSARSGLTLALLVPSLGRLPSGGLQWDALRTLWSRLRPLLAGSMYFKSDLLVDRALASMAPAGHLSLLALAFSVYSTASQIVSRSLVAPAVVGLSRLAARRDWRPFATSYAHHLRLTMLASAVGYVVVLAAATGVLSFGVPGVVAPRSESTRVFLTLLAALGGYFAGGCVGQVVSGRFYATGDTTWPTRVGAVGFTAGIALKALGFYLFGVVGIALGTSSYYVANALTLHAIGRRATRAALVTPTAETRP